MSPPVARTLWAGLLLGISAACAGPPAASTSSEFEGWVDSVVAETLRGGLVPSVSIAVAKGSSFVLEKTWGRADLEHDSPASNDTIYRIASITKQFTAAAVLRLVEQGKVDLDADVATYLPEFRAHGAPITVRQLLNHTSGIPNITDLPIFESKMRLDLTDAETLALFQNQPRNFAPGTNFLYNNSGFYLLAMLIERISGEPISDHMRRTVVEPLGLPSTSVCDDRRITRHRARGYIVAKGALLNEPYVSRDLPKGGGNLCSTAGDLVKWGQALRGGQVVSAQSYQALITPGTLTDGRPIGYGLGVFLSEFNGSPEIFHGGDFYSFTAFLAWYPKDDVTIAVLQNSGAAPAFDGFLARRIVHRLLNGPAGTPFPNAGNDREFERVAGTYRAGASSIDVRRDSADIVVTSDNVWQLFEHRFRPRGGGLFTSLRNPAMSIRFAGDGAHATTLSLTLDGRAFGDAVYQVK